MPAINTIQRASTPGLRKYVGTDKEARKLNVGGEVICYVS